MATILIIADKLLQEAFHHKRTDSLAGMGPRRHNDDIVALRVADRQQGQFPAFVALA